ncbi:hypothetical protein [Ornithinibacillus californiensis]|uniref:hypothetical protein n=1 Tax=Ornithinibacillus californiensis TaxID=161536 RepID=UPI00069F4967|nr:hypothetical protein [Ornithinibacillus californiensis]
MNRLEDFTEFKWIRRETRNIDGNSRVSDFIPQRFTHFCKIMNPFLRDWNIKDKNLVWSKCEPDEELIMNNVEKMTCKQVMDELNLPYTKEISGWSLHHALGSLNLPRYLIFPDEGTMERNIFEETINTLTPFTNETGCYFYFEWLKTVYTLSQDSDLHARELMYHGKLNDVTTLYHRGEGFELGSPTYWWPEDKQWCIFTDYDFDFSIVGGSKEIIDAFLSNDKLECIQVARDTRVDFDADKDNQLRKR